MAKVKTPVKARKTKKIEHLHINLTNKNYMIIGLGILVIIIGYVFMNENSVDGFLPSIVAPILLVIGYLVIVPFGILFSDKSAIAEAGETPSGTANVTTN